MTDRRSRGSVSTGSTTKPDAAVRVRGMVKRYDDRAAVDGLDLDLESGTVLALLGPNGAGKTTTVEICDCLLYTSPSPRDRG